MNTRLTIVLLLAVSWAHAAAPEPIARHALGERERLAVTHGLRYLARTQNRDGSWSSGGSYGRNVGITGLACMAFMANGSQPGRGEFGENIERGLTFVLAHVRDDGYITAGGRSRMYEHGFAALFLGQVYGMTPRQEVGEKLRLTIALIQRAQKRADGGWRYDPTPSGRSDISVAVCQIMALRSARNAGIKVPKAVIDRAIVYVKRSCMADGSFSYMLPGTSRGSYALLSAGLSSLYGAGEFSCPELLRALGRFEATTARNVSRRGPVSHYYFYAHYYAAQAAFHAGGRYWAQYFPAVTTELLGSQATDGSWSSAFGNTFATSMACLILQLPYQHLPIYQRLGADTAAAKGPRRATP